MYTHMYLYIYIYIYNMHMVVSWNGGTPSHHPLLDVFFFHINHPAIGDPFMETPLNPQLHATATGARPKPLPWCHSTRGWSMCVSICMRSSTRPERVRKCARAGMKLEPGYWTILVWLIWAGMRMNVTFRDSYHFMTLANIVFFFQMSISRTWDLTNNNPNLSNFHMRINQWSWSYSSQKQPSEYILRPSRNSPKVLARHLLFLQIVNNKALHGPAAPGRSSQMKCWVYHDFLGLISSFQGWCGQERLGYLVTWSSTSDPSYRWLLDLAWQRQVHQRFVQEQLLDDS